MNQFKFIHSADIHLGKKLSYSGEAKKNLTDILANAEKNSFRRMVDLALAEEVDFIIIAGDLYDLESRSIRASRFFKKQTARLEAENIKVYLISGNHDPAGNKKEPFKLNENVKIFSSEEVEIVEFYKKGELSARILGQSYRQRFEDRSMYNFYTAPDTGIFNIGILHTQLNAENRKYVPATKKNLLSKEEIHYWALGHIHQYQEINSQPGIYFPGTIQGRNINERGPKGVILVEVDQNLNYQKKFIALAELKYQNLYLKLDELEELENISELEEILINKIKLMQEKIISLNQQQKFRLKALILRIIIEGRSQIHNFVKNNAEELELELAAELRNQFGSESPYIWVDSIIFRTASLLDNIEKIKENNPIFKEIDQIINDCLQNNETAAELNTEWGRIWQGSTDPENRKNNHFYANQDLKKEILAEAERLIISELIEDGD